MNDKVSKPLVEVSVSVWGDCLTQFSGYSGWELPEALKGANFKIVPLSSQMAKLHISLEFNLKSFLQVRKVVPRKNRILWALEPRAVAPFQHSRLSNLLFGIKIVQSPLQRLHDRTFVERMGYLPDQAILEELITKFARKSNRASQLCVINENKFSFVFRNGYKLRRSLIKAFSKSGRIVSVAGRHWDKKAFWMLKGQIKALIYCCLNLALPDIRNFSFLGLRKTKNVRFAGRVDSELDFISQHEYNLVVENDPLYLSEKLFNAIIAGAIPIFVGPDLEAFEIPSNIAVCFPPGSTSKEILKKFSTLGKMDESQIRANGFKWISDPENQRKWNHRHSFHTFASFSRKYFDEQIVA